MSKQYSRRKKLFDKFSHQLHLLKNAGLIDVDLKYQNTYICPICTDQFCERDLVSNSDKNFLTEEDAPPAKLNGNRIALTCKRCNSITGHEIDSHLIHQLRNLDDKHYLNSTKQERKIKFEGKTIAATLTPRGNGIIDVFHTPKNNNPSLLDKFIYTLNNNAIGQALHLIPRYPNVKGDRIERALLKIAYIITFARFGYIFLLDQSYDTIRQQIRHMDSSFERHFFLKDQFYKNKIGTYYVMNIGAKSIFNIFLLKTNYSETLIGSLLPMPGITAHEIHSNLIIQGHGINEQGKAGITLNTNIYDPDTDLFTDIDEIMNIVNWKNAL